MSKLKVIGVLLVSVIALTACGGSGGKVTNLNTTDFAAKASDPAVVVLDVRRPDEFAAGHLKNAVLLNYESGTFSEDITKLDKTKTYAVYCHSGRRSVLRLLKWRRLDLLMSSILMAVFPDGWLLDNRWLITSEKDCCYWWRSGRYVFCCSYAQTG